MKNLKKELKRILGENNVSDDPVTLQCYTRDRLPIATSKMFINKHIKLPAFIIRPKSTEQIIEIVKIANKFQIPLIPRSAGTGFMGQSIPNKKNTIILDMRYMDRIIEINKKDKMVTVQPGICAETLDKDLEKIGFIVGHIPGSYSSSTIGGAVSNDGVGSLVQKYGTIRDMVLGMKVVIPTGELLDLKPVSKSSIGYNLKYLFIGAEGTLGIITEVTLRMKELGERKFGFWEFPDFKTAYKAAEKLYRMEELPARISIQDKNRSKAWCEIAGKNLEASIVACFDDDQQVIEKKMEIVNSTLESHNGTALPDNVAKYWWETHRVYTQIPGVWQTLELAVPWSQILELRKRVKIILNENEYDKGIRMAIWTAYPTSVTIDIYIDENDENDKIKCLKIEKAIRESAYELGGSMSIAHGIGMHLADWAKKELGFSLEIMKRIKQLFDPNNIMNPGKMGLGA
jgi:alkyldihydroxyacetonephosphate synthase